MLRRTFLGKTIGGYKIEAIALSISGDYFMCLSQRIESRGADVYVEMEHILYNYFTLDHPVYVVFSVWSFNQFAFDHPKVALNEGIYHL
jgi:hypothetical protein